jgi:2-dehydropantoate 2-reductase
VRAPAEEDSARVGVVDCVIVAVKNYDNATALKLLPPMIGPDTTILTLQNGVDAIDDCAAVAGRERVLGGVTYVFATIEGPGVIVQTGTTSRIVFGEVFSPAERVSERVGRIARAFAEAAIDAQALGDARPALWEKLTYLTPISGLTAASRLPVGGLWPLPAVQDTFRRAVEEVTRVAAAEGISLPATLPDKWAAFVGGLPPGSKSSMLVDLERGRRIEVEALQGSVVRRGRQAGVPTPIVDTLYALLKPFEHGVPRT